MAEQLNTCYIWEQVWNYIQTHRNDSYDTIGEAIGISEADALRLSIDWALGDKEQFKAHFNDIQTTS